MSDLEGSLASTTLDLHCVQNFGSRLRRSHSRVFSDEHRPGYGLWRDPPHGSDRCLLIGLNLEVELVFGGHLVTKKKQVRTSLR